VAQYTLLKPADNGRNGDGSALTGLANREKWATFDPLGDAHADLIRSIRDRLIATANLAPGQRVLDVGAGVGLVAREARQRVAPGGLVVALDISEGALGTCLRRAADEPGAPLYAVAADVLRLPFADATFDVAIARSVLMYLDNHAAVARELYHVLRLGGAAAVYEPINRHTTPARWYDGLDAAALPATHRQIVAELERRDARANPDRPRALAFDERDLTRAFVDAGFAEVRLTYEYLQSAAQQSDTKLGAWYLERSPYGDIARYLLGPGADDLLARLAGMEVKLPPRGRRAEAYLLARR
jgi:demethylmenaquinone methyltransferase/2-methoxy-6-polyprenyl-1,4-benzoquinol methylase